MHNYYIHIDGLVQGVGFRPHVYSIAKKMGLNGWVNNNSDGVHIEINATLETTELFLEKIINSKPTNAIITHSFIKEGEMTTYHSFEIISSDDNNNPSILIPPDYAICNNCKNEIDEVENKRGDYSFTTCLNCGPKYSIMEYLPYDRINTTMKKINMCDDCYNEYNNPANQRHYNQTNSCPKCSIPMHLFNSSNTCLDHNNDTIINTVVNALQLGKIVAVKNTGGYLLLCDATNAEAIRNLRSKKRRPSKPLALLFNSIASASQFVLIRPQELEALNSIIAPIVLCKLKTSPDTTIAPLLIAPQLDKWGVMLPSTPLLYIIAKKVARPLVATSGNISGAPIIYRDADALENLFEVADLVVSYDREILAPQDDSVVQYTEEGQKIILRRSRGLAPNYFPHPIKNLKETILATGGEIKSAFAYTHKAHLYISQFLGDQTLLESQDAYAQTFRHFQKLFKSLPEIVLIDTHPNYFVSASGKDIAQKLKIPCLEIQHHKAHFASVLVENDLMKTSEKVLGFIWDGTGYGEDEQIWGSEIFIYNEHTFTRIAHLDYFPLLMGDKMSKEPRLSALSILHQLDEDTMVKKYFSTQEWIYYQNVLSQPNKLSTSSMGRFLDALLCIMGIDSKVSYEGEGIMKLETIARNSYPHMAYYSLKLIEEKILWNSFFEEFLHDIKMNKEAGFIARKIINSLVELIVMMSDKFKINKLAFSGGVFQNALLVDLLIQNTKKTKTVYFQKEVSPNDEGVALGQIAYYLNEMQHFQHDDKNEIGEEIEDNKLITI
jgi:hydrogenase maturation protein HypF